MRGAEGDGAAVGRQNMSWIVEGNGCLDHVPTVITNTGDELTGDELPPSSSKCGWQPKPNSVQITNKIAEFTHGPSVAGELS